MGTNALKKGIYHKIQLFDNIYLFRGVKKKKYIKNANNC